ncbi:MopE-related protein [Myxococcota bacterium]
MHTDLLRNATAPRKAALCSVTMAFILIATNPASAENGLGHNGRWLTYDGQPLFAVGFDCQELASNTAIDYETMLDLFAAYEMNKVRLWIYTWFMPFNPTTPNLTPWARNGNGQHDLDNWDEEYWQRLKAFITAAGDRGIMVELSIFAPYPWAGWWWSKVAWNEAFNSNGAFTSNPSGHFDPQFFDLNGGETSSSGKTLAQYQQALVTKTVDELGGLPNAYFEVCNEFSRAGRESWQLHWANELHDQTTQLVGVQPFFYADGWSYESWAQHWNESTVDVLNLRFAKWNVLPQTISDSLHAAQTRGKVLSVNEGNNENTAPVGTSFAVFLNHETRYAWAITLAGGYFTYYWDKSEFIGGNDWIAAASRMRVIRHIVERLRFAELSPVDASGNEYDSLITQGPGSGGWQVMANPGEEYLAYFWGTPSASSVLIDLPADSAYSYSWYDTRNEAILGEGEISGNGSTTIPAPAAVWDAVAGVALLLTTPCGTGNCDATKTCLSCPEECGSCDGPGCRGAAESTSTTLSCPAGQQIATIDFASYGTPNGGCGTFAVGECHSADTSSVLESECLEQPSCTVEASNTSFGDPCAGVGKRLFVQYSCEPITSCMDQDGDGFRDNNCGGDDCDDDTPTVYPGASEVCSDGIDQDCNNEDLECGCVDEGTCRISPDTAAQTLVGGCACTDTASNSFGWLLFFAVACVVRRLIARPATLRSQAEPIQTDHPSRKAATPRTARIGARACLLLSLSRPNREPAKPPTRIAYQPPSDTIDGSLIPS